MHQTLAFRSQTPSHPDPGPQYILTNSEDDPAEPVDDPECHEIDDSTLKGSIILTPPPKPKLRPYSHTLSIPRSPQKPESEISPEEFLAELKNLPSRPISNSPYKILNRHRDEAREVASWPSMVGSDIDSNSSELEYDSGMGEISDPSWDERLDKDEFYDALEMEGHGVDAVISRPVEEAESFMSVGGEDDVLEKEHEHELPCEHADSLLLCSECCTCLPFSLESCHLQGSELWGTEGGLLAEKPVGHSQIGASDKKIARQGCCIHGHGEECVLWCLKTCCCGGHTFDLIMPKAEKLLTPEASLAREAERIKYVAKEYGRKDEVEERKSKRATEKKGSKWEDTYLRGLVLGKDREDENEAQSESEEDGKDIFDEVAIAATATAVMVGCLCWLESGAPA